MIAHTSRLAVFCWCLLVATKAFAFSGYMTATIQYFENNGNYCDNATQGQDCTDTMYTSAQFGGMRAVPDAQILIYGFVTQPTSQWVVIGQGSTDVNGKFVAQWFSTFKPTSAYFVLNADQKNDKFRVRQTDGSLWAIQSNQIVPVDGTTSGSPQTFSSAPFGWGQSAASANPVANVYAMAHLQYQSLTDSATLATSFTGVEVRAFYAPGVGGPLGACGSACAGFSGSQPYVQLPVGSGFSPQARILHEMGHIASNLLQRRAQAVDYCWPDTAVTGGCADTNADGFTEPDANGDGITDPGPAGWVLNPVVGAGATFANSGGEWGNIRFEEGFATFIGDRAIYRQGAPEPTTCISATSCIATNAWQQVERSTGNGATSTCQALTNALRRSPLLVDRYLRDIYDTSNDSAPCAIGATTCQRNAPAFNDTHFRSFGEILGVISRFQDGRGDHQDEEPFNAAGAIDDLDGFRAADFNWVYKNQGTPLIDTDIQRTYNCVLL
jgi:hypothetical protein